MGNTQTESAGGAAVAELTFLDQILDETRALNDNERERNQTYIEQFVAKVVEGEATVSKDVVTSINSWIAEIDSKLSKQLAEVMHCDDFQKLEGTWRGFALPDAEYRNRYRSQDSRSQRKEGRTSEGLGKGS